MFGVRVENKNKEIHFANAAKRFAMDAKMLKCRAAVHVENKDDIFFGALFLSISGLTTVSILLPVPAMSSGMKPAGLPNA